MVEPSEPVIRLGVVGGGLIAQLAHLPALRELDRLYAVHALAEPSTRVREGLARRYGIPVTAARHEPLLESGGLDALLVASPNGTHARVVGDALDAGLHVLVEKPLCLSPADAVALTERAGRADRVLQVGYMKRFDPAYERLLAAAPGLGAALALHTVTVDPGIGERLRPAGFIAAGDHPAADGRELLAQVADALGDDDPRHAGPFSDAFQGALVHDVNLVHGLRPGPWRVRDAVAGEGLAHGALAHERGARWSATWARVPAADTFREELVLCARDGVARLRFPAPYLGSAPAELRLDGAPERRWATPANAYVRQLAHFHACVTRGEPCRAPAEQAVADVALLTELYKAAIA